QRFGSAELKARYLPGICDGSAIGAHAITERTGGSDAAAMRMTAIARGDSYVLNGEKRFISSGPVADLFLVYAKTDPEQGAFGMTAFVVERDTPGLTVGPPIDKMGLRTSPFCDVTFDDCVVPAANVVGRPGRGFFILDHVMKWEILCSFIISVGAMRHRMERCAEFARSRTQFGAAIGSCQLIADKIVDMRIGVETAAKWLYDTAERFVSGADVMVDIAIAKLLASEANLRSAADAVQVFGARGYLTEYGIEKELRDATGGTIYSGTSEIQRDKIARMLGIQRTEGEMMIVDTTPGELLAVTEFLDHDHPAVTAFVADALAGRWGTPKENAVALYYAVRDGLDYEVYNADLSRAGLRASAIIARGQ